MAPFARQRVSFLAVVVALMAGLSRAVALRAESLPGTRPLTLEGDLPSQMVDGIDTFLLHETEESIGRHAAFWPSLRWMIVSTLSPRCHFHRQLFNGIL